MKKVLTPENLSILVVDDVKSMRSVLRSMLKNLKIGGTLHMAENGVEGLKILHTNKIDIALIDWKMPVMNGIQMLESIRKDRMFRDLPVLMISAESEKDIVLDAAEIEVEAYLIKPLTPAVLEEKIKQIIAQVNHPDKATLHARKARQLEEKKDIAMAVKHLQRAVELKPGASRLIRKLGLLYLKAGNENLFVEYLKKAVSANNQDVISLQLLGEYYRRKNELITALNYYLDVVEMTRKFNDNAIELAQDLLKEGENRNAKLLFTNIIARSRNDTRLIEDIVNCCMEYNEYAYALSLLKKLMQILPNNWDIVYQAGRVCEKMDNIDDALNYFLRVDKHQYARIDVKLRIARILIFRKKVIQADNFINQVLQKEPENRDALELRRLI